ncbi:MAG: hypothetical protein M1840_005988 [Geoglossum simile]|nr:MAG: hypothetical protein M1840_005988 [Geoglossum simile]
MENTTYESQFLELVHTPIGPHKIDLVFVHGLNPFDRNRHAFETWTHENGTFWPAALLAEDIPFARIYVYGYNSSIKDPKLMSTSSIKEHANILLNLLDMERSPEEGTSASKIIFVGHSLGGLVIKQALLNAHENPQYTAIRTATFGLVFFGCPHHGAKGVELGMVAATLAKFVSNGRASNELLESLRDNSLFTKEMSDRFSHQLLDYRVVSFIEGRPLQLLDCGPASVSHIVVDEQSAVLGLPGTRETRLKLDADHSAMCKIGTKGPMYKLVKGNIKRLADQALVALQGYVPPPPAAPPTPLPKPPSFHPNGQTSRPPESAQGVVGTMYNPTGQDPRSIAVVEHMNMGHWQQARQLEHQIFEEQQRILGVDHLTTLSTGYNISFAELQLGFLDNAASWSGWVSSSCQRIAALGPKHPLFMKAESLNGEILRQKGQPQDAETVIGNVLARQQNYLGDDHLDTLETQRSLAFAVNSSGRKNDALARLQKRTAALARLLGANHIHVFASTLDLVEVMLPSRIANPIATSTFSNEVLQASVNMTSVSEELRTNLGPQHPLAIRAQRICAAIKHLEGNSVDASDMLHRALSFAEDTLGPDHPETIAIVVEIAYLYIKPVGFSRRGRDSAEARPWLIRYLKWVEARKGNNHPETRTMLCFLGTSYMAANDYAEAEVYFERLSTAYRGVNSKEAQEANQMLGLCQMNTRLTKQRAAKNGMDLSSFLSGLRFS